MSTYSTESFDNTEFHEIHFQNRVVHYLQTRNLKLNLQTLKPCKKSVLQDSLDPGLVSRIRGNQAYQKFSEEKISFSNCSTCTFHDLTQLQHDYLDYYFELDYDNRITYDTEFKSFHEQDRVNLIKERHQQILNDCKGLRFNFETPLKYINVKNARV